MFSKKLLQGIMHSGGNIAKGMIDQNRIKNQFFCKVNTIILQNKLCKPISLC